MDDDFVMTGYDFADPLYEANGYYGRTWVAGQPSHMPGYFMTTPHDGAGNQVLPISIRGPVQAATVGYAASWVDRDITSGGPIMSQLPGGLSGNSDSSQYRNLRAGRWTDNLYPGQ